MYSFHDVLLLDPQPRFPSILIRLPNENRVVARLDLQANFQCDLIEDMTVQVILNYSDLSQLPAQIAEHPTRAARVGETGANSTAVGRLPSC
jgi:hypothetical protein